MDDPETVLINSGVLNGEYWKSIVPDRNRADKGMDLDDHNELRRVDRLALSCPFNTYSING